MHIYPALFTSKVQVQCAYTNVLYIMNAPTLKLASVLSVLDQWLNTCYVLISLVWMVFSHQGGFSEP